MTPSEKANREDFAARVRGDHPEEIAWRRLVVGELRLAYRRAKLHMEAIKEAANMIEGGVDPEEALSSIGDALDYVIPTRPEEIDTSDIPEVGEEWFQKAELIMPERDRHDGTPEASESEGVGELQFRAGRAEIYGDGE